MKFFKRVSKANDGEPPYRCPCCNHKTLGAWAAFEICPVCYWEDDGQGERDADVVRGGPNGALSLRLAQENFARVGAADPKFIKKVRKPYDDE